MKSKLKIEELSVESFVVAETEDGRRGTVRAFAKPPRETFVEFTFLVDDCQPTFVFSCPYGPETCGVLTQTLDCP